MHSGLELIDRSSYARFREVRDARLASESGYFDVLDTVHERHRAQLTREFSATLQEPLSACGRTLVNACLREVVAMLRRTYGSMDVDTCALERAYAIMAPCFEPGETLEEVMALDCFHSVLPYFDGPALCQLVRRETLDRELEQGICATLQHRFLHGPQRTRHLFFHEMAVGYLLNELEAPEVLPERTELRLQPESYAVVPAMFVHALARALHRDASDLCGLHFCDDARLTRALPEAVQDLMLASAQLYFYGELRMIYGWKVRNGALIEHVIKFFSLPALDLLAAHDFRHRLRDDAGAIIDELFVTRIYGDSTARAIGNEVDLVLAFHELSSRVWTLSS